MGPHQLGLDGLLPGWNGARHYVALAYNLQCSCVNHVLFVSFSRIGFGSHVTSIARGREFVRSAPLFAPNPRKQFVQIHENRQFLPSAFLFHLHSIRRNSWFCYSKDFGMKWRCSFPWLCQIFFAFLLSLAETNERATGFSLSLSHRMANTNGNPSSDHRPNYPTRDASGRKKWYLWLTERRSRYRSVDNCAFDDRGRVSCGQNCTVKSDSFVFSVPTSWEYNVCHKPNVVTPSNELQPTSGLLCSVIR